MRSHVIRVEFGSNESGWRRAFLSEGYAIDLNLLTPADAFSVQVPADASKDPNLPSPDWLSARPDNEVRAYLDDRPVFAGLIDKRRFGATRDGELIAIDARDMIGRLVDESAPLVKFDGLRIVDLVKRFADGGVIRDVVTSNAENRRLLSGSRKKSKEPVIDSSRQAPRKVNPGETCWQVISHFLEEAALLLWASGDGQTLVLGKPNYTQAPAFEFRYLGPKSPSNNVISIEYEDSVAEMYSYCTAIGAGGKSATERDNGSPVGNGVGSHFRIRKRLTVSDDGARDHRARARREMAERRLSNLKLKVTISGHSFDSGSGHVFLAPDMVATVRCPRSGINGSWWIAGVKYSCNRGAGQTTEVTLLPSGSDVRMTG